MRITAAVVEELGTVAAVGPGVTPVGEGQVVDSVGMRGTAILLGGAAAGAEFSVDHLSTLWGRSVVGTLGGSGRSLRLIGALMDLYAAGRFPFDRLVELFPPERIEEAVEASYSGDVIKPVPTMQHRRFRPTGHRPRRRGRRKQGDHRHGTARRRCLAGQGLGRVVGRRVRRHL